MPGRGCFRMGTAAFGASTTVCMSQAHTYSPLIIFSLLYNVSHATRFVPSHRTTQVNQFILQNPCHTTNLTSPFHTIHCTCSMSHNSLHPVHPTQLSIHNSFHSTHLFIACLDLISHPPCHATHPRHFTPHNSPHTSHLAQFDSICPQQFISPNPSH